MRLIERGILKGGKSPGITFPILKEFVNIITEKDEDYFNTHTLDSDGNTVFEFRDDYFRNGGKI